VDLFRQCEWGGAAAKHAIANSEYRLNGQTFAQAGRAPVTPTAGYFYSGETFTPAGLQLGGQQVILQKPGCRPRFFDYQKAWSATSGSYYINCFADGEVWITTSMMDRIGTQLSWPTAGVVLPRGVRYIHVLLVGAGGGGGGGSHGGDSHRRGGAGGGGGATAYCCVRLPDHGFARFNVAIAGWSGDAGKDGLSGGSSSITYGQFFCTAGGGSGGGGGLGDLGYTPTPGGEVICSGDNEDGCLVAVAPGGKGGKVGDENFPGDSASIYLREHAPEAKAEAFVKLGGAGGKTPGSIYVSCGGGGGASAFGRGGDGSPNSNGGNASGYGGGGGGSARGGATALGGRLNGGNGTGGYVEIRY